MADSGLPEGRRLSAERWATIEAVAADIDVMGGRGHVSMLTEKGMKRRHAAVLIRSLADEVQRARSVVIDQAATIDALRSTIADLTAERDQLALDNAWLENLAESRGEESEKIRRMLVAAEARVAADTPRLQAAQAVVDAWRYCDRCTMGPDAPRHNGVGEVGRTSWGEQVQGLDAAGSQETTTDE